MWQLILECGVYILNMLAIGGLAWNAFQHKEQSEARRQQVIALEKYLLEIETEEGGLRRLCGDFPPSAGENKMANRILSVVRRWRIESK